MSDYRYISWRDGEAREKGFGASNRGKATTIKIELEVTDATRLGMILSDLQEAKNPPAPPPATTAPRPRRKPELLALPAPTLRLGYGGDR